MHLRKPLFLLLGAGVIALMVLPSSGAQTLTTLTLMSGNGAVGSADPANEFSFNNGVTWNPAIIVAPGQQGYPQTGYDTIPGTRYIARSVTGANPANVTTRYRAFFTLPPGYQFPVLSVSVHADNKGTVFLNGTSIGGQAQNVASSNFQNPPETFVSANPALFQAGQNTLEIRVYNFTNVSALDYKAQVTFAVLNPPGINPCVKPTITGTPGNDGIVALNGPQVIDGRGGNDSIVTGPFNDVICGGPGDDAIASGAGDDIIFGGPGNDRMAGGSGTDLLFGQQGNDQLNGGPGFDVCSDTQGVNTFSQCP